MVQDSEDSLICFNKIITDKWSKLTEADTRSKIIDSIFKEALNWNEKDINREEGIAKGYVDYIFSIDERPVFIVEAKKEGISFVLPEDINKRSYKINGIIAKSKQLHDAIEQASRYCYEKGIRFAIITNGSQFIIFEGLKVGASWRDGRCLIFKNHEDIQKTFVLFWNLLNRFSVSKGSFNRLLIENVEIICFNRPIDTLHNKDEVLIRNYLNRYLRPLIEHIFEEITDDSQLEVLKSCYVFDKAYISLNDDMESYFVDKMPYFSAAQGIRFFKESANSAGEFQFNFRKCEEFINKYPFSGSVIALLGGIGSGKTTFIHRFFRVILSKRKNLLWFYVDFRDSPIDEKEIKDFIYAKIIENMDRKYDVIIKKLLAEAELNQPDKNSCKEYVSCIFALLKSLSYSIALVIDNVDQHTQLFQQQIFQVTKNISKTQRIISILSLREESFVMATQKGVQDADYTHAYHIPSPRFEMLIEARLNYAITLLNKDVKEIKTILRTQIDIEKKLDEILDFFEIIRTSIKSKVGSSLFGINLFLTSIASGNMRKALKMFNNFLTSGNTDIDNMLLIHRTSGDYQIPYHAFIKSIILGDSRFFLTDKNPFVFNLFDVNTNFHSSHFLHLRILNFAYQNFQNSSPVGKGFIEISSLKNEASTFFITNEAIDDSLLKLASKDLVQFENQSQKDLKNAAYFSITPTGIYFLKFLVKRFVYLDLIWIDTPISDVSIQQELVKYTQVDSMPRSHEDKLKLRFRRVESFIRYLSETERREFSLHPEYKESKLMYLEIMRNIESSFVGERSYILGKQTLKKRIKDEKSKDGLTIADIAKIKYPKST